MYYEEVVQLQKNNQILLEIIRRLMMSGGQITPADHTIIQSMERTHIENAKPASPRNDGHAFA